MNLSRNVTGETISSSEENPRDLSCKKDNYIEINNQLDCFGSKEPHNDDTNSVILTGAKDPLKADTNDAILRGLNSCSPQKDGKNSCRLTRGDVGKSKCKLAFTLAEVLITLGIIGVVAAITLPTVINKCQSYILKQQFRKAYSTLFNAIKLVQVQNGSPIACYYWEKNPYAEAGNTAVCVKNNEYGSCVAWKLKDGSPIPSDYTGQMFECRKFNEDLIKTLKIVKFCEKEALKNGCLTENYRGADKVKKEQNPDKNIDPNSEFSDTNIKNKYPAFITPDGVLYIRYISAVPLYVFDINGHKGPNKWGYDIFSFMLTGNKKDGITKIVGQYHAAEKGGKYMQQMINNF